MSASTSLPDSLSSPSTFLPWAAERRLFWPPLVGATLVALLFAALAVPRTDFEGAAQDAIERQADSAQMSPHEMETNLATARRVGTLGAYLGAALGTGLRVMGAALALWLGFKVAGGTPGLAGTFTVACWGLVPGAIELLLAIPALLARSRVAPDELGRLLPAGLGAFLPTGSKGPLASLLWSLDLFSVWAVVLVAIGMASVAGVSRRRSLVTVAVLWIGYVSAFQVALPTFGGQH